MLASSSDWIPEQVEKEHNERKIRKETESISLEPSWK